MRLALIVCVATAVAACATDPTPINLSPSAQGVTATDRDQVERLVYEFEDAWNRHDMIAFANLFYDDAEWVHWRGGLWAGKKEIYEGHKAVHEAYYRTSHAKVQGIEALHFLSPEVAYVRVRSDMTGDARYPGQTFRYRRTMLMLKRSGEWRIIKGHNTRIVGSTGVDWKPTQQ